MQSHNDEFIIDNLISGLSAFDEEVRSYVYEIIINQMQSFSKEQIEDMISICKLNMHSGMYINKEYLRVVEVITALETALRSL